MDYRASNRELEHWLRDIGKGDRDALASLYRATSGPVYGYALSLLKNPQDAEDVLHDCYISIWNSAATYRRQEKPMAWILTVTRNLCLKRLRNRNRHVPLETAWNPATVSDPEEAALLRACMQALSEEERQTVVLHAVVGLRHRDIAGILGLKPSTVMSKYRRAIQKLKAQL